MNICSIYNACSIMCIMGSLCTCIYIMYFILSMVHVQYILHVCMCLRRVHVHVHVLYVYCIVLLSYKCCPWKALYPVIQFTIAPGYFSLLFLSFSAALISISLWFVTSCCVGGLLASTIITTQFKGFCL